MLFSLFPKVLIMMWAAGGTNSWPLVQPFTHEWRIPDIGSTNRDTPVLAYINDIQGTPVYKIECHNGNYSDQSEMNFSGTFQCAIFAVRNGRNASWNLFASKEEQDSDWNNRGRMLAEQLQDSCGNWPEYGLRRTFLLRNMKIMLIFKDLQWLGDSNNVRLGSFPFEIQVQADPRAKAAQAEIPHKPKPGKNCLW